MASRVDICEFPDIGEPYATALRQAVIYILENYEAVGIIAAGSILYGKPNATSDLDLYVVNAQSNRQRVQKYFNNVPAEIFINPPHQIEKYLESESANARPLTAHMLAHGFVVLSSDRVVADLIQRARQMLECPPNPPADQIVYLAYMAATQYEDARDIWLQDPAGALMILHMAVHKMLQFVFWEANRYLPRDKDLLATLAAERPNLGELAQRYFVSDDRGETRFALAEQIADLTIGEHGFFEWESPLEEI